MDRLSRTALLLGEDGIGRLRRSRVAVFGLGGVGGQAAEALVRSGIGAVDLIDSDTVSVTNLNRQVIALHSTVGRPKTAVLAERLRDIAPDCTVRTVDLFYLPENADRVDLSAYTYVVDAVDTVAAKLEIAERCFRLGVPLISAMGAGNRLDPSQLLLTDLYQTNTDGLARVMRKELRRRGVTRLRVACSAEPAIAPCADNTAEIPEGSARRSLPGSTAFVPAAMGLLIASAIVREIALQGRAPQRLHEPCKP